LDGTTSPTQEPDVLPTRRLFRCRQRDWRAALQCSPPATDFERRGSPPLLRAARAAYDSRRSSARACLCVGEREWRRATPAPSELRLVVLTRQTLETTRSTGHLVQRCDNHLNRDQRSDRRRRLHPKMRTSRCFRRKQSESLVRVTLSAHGLARLRGPGRGGGGSESAVPLRVPRDTTPNPFLPPGMPRGAPTRRNDPQNVSLWGGRFLHTDPAQNRFSDPVRYAPLQMFEARYAPVHIFARDFFVAPSPHTDFRSRSARI
jgi:hypothetical protein